MLSSPSLNNFKFSVVPFDRKGDRQHAVARLDDAQYTTDPFLFVFLAHPHLHAINECGFQDFHRPIVEFFHGLEEWQATVIHRFRALESASNQRPQCGPKARQPFSKHGQTTRQHVGISWSLAQMVWTGQTPAWFPSSRHPEEVRVSVVLRVDQGQAALVTRGPRGDSNLTTQIWSVARAAWN